MPGSFWVILVPQPDGGFFVECPSVPGCYSQGDTREEAIANIREAIEIAVDDLRASGQVLPQTGAPEVEEIRISA